MHDKNGKPLKVGDKVTVEAVIRETYATDEYCNVQIGIGYEDGKEHGAHNVQSIVTINSKQVELVEES